MANQSATFAGKGEKQARDHALPIMGPCLRVDQSLIVKLWAVQRVAEGRDTCKHLLHRLAKWLNYQVAALPEHKALQHMEG